MRVHGFPEAWRSLFHWLFDGELGVRWFFLISGYLITWLLLKERDHTGDINLGRFYLRRGLRLMPVYFAYLATLVTLQWMTIYSQRPLEWFGNIVFLTNFVGCTWPGAHLWSLAVEQQFYLVWPILLAYLTKRETSHKSTLMVLLVPLILSPLCRVVSYTQGYQGPLSFIFTSHSFFNYFDSLAIGCMAATVFARNPDRVQEILIKHRVPISIFAGILVLTPYILSKLFLLGIITVPIGPTMQALGFAIFMLQSIQFPEGFAGWRLLNHKFIAEIGVLSYSLYIWQQLFCTDPDIFGFPAAWWNGFPFWLAATTIVAMISYYGLEKPLVKLRAKLRKT